MFSEFDNVKDSSIWFQTSSLKMINNLDNRLYIGIVREAHNDANTKELRYIVEIHHKNDIILSNCRMLRRWGGVYNYEDYIMHGYNHNSTSNNQNGVAAVPGDVVLVSQLGGQGREGIILGAMTHVARKNSLDTKDGPQYRSEFNGIETSINKDGEWILTFKGQPTNLSKLDQTPSEPVPAPEYDTDVGTSYMKWDKTGSFTLSDEATDGDKIQRLFIDKKNGTIDIDSGKINLQFIKKDQAVTLTCKKFVVEGEKIRLGEEGASDWLILGSKFRKEQKSMNNTVSQKLTAARIALTAAQALLSTAGAAMAVPIAGAIAAGPQITSAATLINQAASALGDAGTAISTFESNGLPHDYLSEISKTK
jgi:hypothetical protein